MTLGDRIREARQQAGFSNVETLAVRLRVGVRTVQRWETGGTEPSLEKLRELAAVTDRPLAWFLNGDGRAH